MAPTHVAVVLPACAQLLARCAVVETFANNDDGVRRISGFQHVPSRLSWFCWPHIATFATRSRECSDSFPFVPYPSATGARKAYAYRASRISLALTQSLLTGDLAAAASLLQNLAARSDAIGAWRTLAGAPELSYSMAAEILLLIETLEKPPVAPTPRRPSATPRFAPLCELPRANRVKQGSARPAWRIATRWRVFLTWAGRNATEAACAVRFTAG